MESREGTHDNKGENNGSNRSEIRGGYLAEAQGQQSHRYFKADKGHVRWEVEEG